MAIENMVTYNTKKCGPIGTVNLPVDVCKREDGTFPPCHGGKIRRGLSIEMARAVWGDDIPADVVPYLVAGGCYACKGHDNCANVKEGKQARLETYLKTPRAYFMKVAAETANSHYARFFESGDIVDAAYLRGMVKVAEFNKETRYLAYTKKYSLVNAYLKETGGALPKNLTIVFSGWDRYWKVDNPYSLPVTYVEWGGERGARLNADFPAGALRCAGSNAKCAACLKCWHLKQGQTLIFPAH